MKRLLASVAALALLSSSAVAANLTPDQLTQATTINNSNLLLIYPTGGPMQSVQWSVLKSLMQTALGTAYLQVGNNLSDLASPASARNNLGLGTASTLNSGTSGGVLGLLNGVNQYSAEQFFQAGSTSSASINLAPGVAPTAPINGDLWTTSAAPFVRINGVTQQLGFALGYTPLNKAGDTASGDLLISNTVASFTRFFGVQTSGVNRWLWGADNTAETGSNTGSNWELCNFNDGGTGLNCPIFITRSTGNITFENAIQVNGVGNFPGGLSGSLTGNASTATKLATARTISLTGSVSATCPSFDGSANITCTTTGSMIQVRLQTTTGGSSGESLSASSWLQRALNAAPFNTIAGAGLSANQLQLPAGSYSCNVTAPFDPGSGGAAVASRLRNVTDGTTVGKSSYIVASATGAVVSNSFSADFQIFTAKIFQVETYTNNPGTGGAPMPGTNNTEPEVYTEVTCTKVG